MDVSFPEEDVRDIATNLFEFHPNMKKDNLFMMEYGESIVAGLVLIPQRWVIDGVEIKVAEMGCVCTHPDHRRRGLQGILNKKFDEYAKKHEYDLYTLAGIPYFYRQFNYQYAIDLDFSTEIIVEDLPDTPYTYRTRTSTKQDIKWMNELLTETLEKYLVKSIRTLDVWGMQLKTGTYGGTPLSCVVLLKKNERVGYCRYLNDRKNKILCVKEVGFNEKTTIEEVMGFLKNYATAQGLETLKTTLPPQDQINIYLGSHGASTKDPYAWQLKTLDLAGLLQKMVPVFSQGILESQFKNASKKLVFNFWKYSVEMNIMDGEIHVGEKKWGQESRSIGFNPYVFIQMLMGYRSRQELMNEYPDVMVKDEFCEIIDVLFPKKGSFIHYAY